VSDRYILDDDGNCGAEPDLMRWAKWLETADRHLARDDIGFDVWVSTVFLGLDHSFGGGPPVLWETMIFGGPHDQYQDRHTSRDDALAGHAAAVALARSAP
jgi:hypothetical protein